MAKNMYRVAADVPSHARQLLLDRFRPRLENVFAKSITWAYNVPGDFDFDTREQTVTIYGIHRTDRTEALLLRLGAAEYQHDGARPLHLTYSLAAGAKPVEAGQIDWSRVERLRREFVFTSRLKAHPLWDLARVGQGTRRHAA